MWIISNLLLSHNLKWDARLVLANLWYKKSELVDYTGKHKHICPQHVEHGAHKKMQASDDDLE